MNPKSVLVMALVLFISMFIGGLGTGYVAQALPGVSGWTATALLYVISAAVVIWLWQRMKKWAGD